MGKGSQVSASLSLLPLAQLRLNRDKFLSTLSLPLALSQISLWCCQVWCQWVVLHLINKRSLIKVQYGSGRCCRANRSSRLHTVYIRKETGHLPSFFAVHSADTHSRPMKVSLHLLQMSWLHSCYPLLQMP